MSGQSTEKWKPATSVEQVSKECRSAIFGTMFHTFAADAEGNKENVKIGRSKAIGFCQFGVASGLLSPDEGNEWLDAIWERKALAEVNLKYNA